MTGAQLTVAVLSAAHDRTGFDCGTPALDRYLRETATQDVRRRVAACFVMRDRDAVVGYYTLSAASIALADLPLELTRKLPRYPAILRRAHGPAGGRRAIPGRGIGAALRVNALRGYGNPRGRVDGRCQGRGRGGVLSTLRLRVAHARSVGVVFAAGDGEIGGVAAG